MKKIVFAFLVVLSAVLVGCAISPRVSSWNSPARFDSAQVFNAVLQAGPLVSMQSVSSDREAKTASFSKTFATDGKIQLNATVINTGKQIQVRTNVSISPPKGQLPIAGFHEDVIRDFHKQVFEILNISDQSETNVVIAQK